MKKFLTFVALTFGMVTMANAEENSWRPEKSSGIELGFQDFKFNETSLKYRHFISDKHALRLKFVVGFDNTTTTETTSERPMNKGMGDVITESSIETKDEYFNLDFMVGYEYHFFTKGRFDVYGGLELGYGMTNCSGSKTGTVNTTKYDTKDAPQSYSQKTIDITYNNRTSDEDEKSLRAFKANLFYGVDFYVYKGLYLGAELGFGFQTGKSPNGYRTGTEKTVDYDSKKTETGTSTTLYSETYKTITTTAPGTASLLRYSDVESNETTSTSFKLAVQPALRIGWTF